MTNDSPPKQERKEVVDPVKYIPSNNDVNSTSGNKPAKKINKVYEMTNQRWASQNTDDENP